MLTLNDGRNELWQWDTGRKLKVDADCSQVHFSNKIFGRSLDVDVVDGVASIPDILLQTEKDLIAWAFVGTAENGYTKISKVFKVNRRNKPADYVFTPSEQTTLAEIMERLDGLESIQDPDAIKNAVDDYLANNPIKVDETDPTVPEWAKQATPPDVKIPDKLPNPNALTFTGAVTGSYDGTDPVTIDIPAGTIGEDGFSPIATVEQTESGAVISVTDKNGTTTATIVNGKDGTPGDPGEDGKSAYEYAQDAGYTGSESAFAAKLAEEPVLACFTSETTPAQVVAAINAGKNVALIHTDDTFGLLVFTGFLYVQSVNAGVSSGIWDFGGTPMRFSLLGDVGTGKWNFTYDMLADIEDIPEIPGALPNPNALTFTGAVSGTYDGSSAVTINIPVSGGNAEDGFSPIAKVEQTATGAVVSITDKTGTTTATIANGRDGKDGADGKDGYTPQKNVDYFDGKDGQNGKDGQDGQDYVLTPADKSEIAEMAAGMVDVSTANAVSYEEQSRTEAQKAQARQNIGAVKSTGWTAGKNLGTDENGNIIEKDDIFSKDVSGWHPVECLTGATWTNLGYFWDTAGNLVSTQYTGNYISTTEKIPIAPNCSYVVSGIAGVVTLYDASGKNGVQAVVKDDPNTTYPFETNANQYFMGVSHKPTGIWDETRVSVLRTTISKEEYDAIPTKADSLKSLFGKKIVCFGDSLFGMHRGDDSATAFIAAETGATVYNVGFGGCRMSVHHSSGYAEFSMWALAKAIAENNWSAQDSAASKGSSYFPEQLALLKSIDFSDVDIAVIHYGTNDFGAGNVIAMDNPADHDDYTTLCGALRYSIEKLLGAYPKLRIYVSLPVYRYWTDNGVNTYAETYLNVGGKTLPEFVEALRSTAAEYNLPVIDGYYGLGINKENAPTFLSDGTHHNKAGRERFGRYIGRNLISQQTTGKSGSVSGGNVDLGVTGATVGQTVKISAVDENGKPTEWETVDFPEGKPEPLVGTIQTVTPSQVSEALRAGRVVVIVHENGLLGFSMFYDFMESSTLQTVESSGIHPFDDRTVWYTLKGNVSDNSWSFEYGELGEGGSGGASTWDDLGSTYGEGFVLPECSPIFDESVENFIFTEAFPLVEGNEYTVNWNGTPYKCICSRMAVNGITGLGLGNIGAITGGTNTGEPFCLGVYDDPEALGFPASAMPMDGSTTITISITAILEKITPVPEKYLPKNGILYVDADKFLYKTADTSNPKNLLSTRELRTMFEIGTALYVAVITDDGSEVYRTPSVVGFGEGRGSLMIKFGRDGSNQTYTCWTATDEERAELTGA